MNILSTAKMLLLVATLAIGVSRAVAQDVTFPLPPGMVRVLPRTYSFPVTNDEYAQEARMAKESGYPLKLDAYRDEVKLTLTKDQVIEFYPASEPTNPDKELGISFELKWLDEIPADRLRSLFINSSIPSTKCIARLGRQKELQHLSLICFGVDIEGLVDACPQLTQFYLSQDHYTIVGDAFSDKAFEHVGRLKNLRSFTFSEHGVTNPSLGKVAKWPKLEAFHLQLERDTKITDDGLKLLAKSESLREIQLSLTPQILENEPVPKVTNEGLRALATAPSLKHLNIVGFDHFDESMRTELTAALKGVTVRFKKVGE